VEEKRLAAERAAEDERRKTAEVHHITALQYSIAKNGSTENAGPENGGPKKMKELKMQD